MNSKISDESTSGSQEDNNANLNNGLSKSKGAVPKITSLSKTSINTMKSIKVNNNVENIASHNGVVDSNSVNLKINGFSKAITNNYVNASGGVEKHVDDIDSTSLSLGTSVSLQDIHLDDGSSSSSSEDNDLSVSDDGCIYTYKGDGVADLPSSFYNIELPAFDNNALSDEQRESNSSPEMDFLEMDFDPGPSGDADSESSSSQVDQPVQLPLDQVEEEIYQEPCCSKDLETMASSESKNGLNKASPNIDSILKSEEKEIKNDSSMKACHKEIRMPWSCTLLQRTRGSKQLRVVKKHMNSFGELSSPKEIITPTSDYMYSWSNEELEGDNRKFMIWNDQEASLKQITQIGPSSCGATAVLNVLIALRLPIPSLDIIQESVQTKLRSNFSPLSDYLKSRNQAGCTHKEIINGLNATTNGRVYSRFFSMYPERRVNIYKWLGFWIQNGAVPVATLNLQKCEGPVPDSWHHQMIYGVDPNNVYLTNPLECVNASALWHQLVSESVLLIRREDVLSRWNPRIDLVELGKITDTRWKSLNVLGQVAKIVREQPRESRENSTVTSHIKIPASYKSGITIAIDINSPAYPLLLECPELPLLNLSNAAISS